MRESTRREGALVLPRRFGTALVSNIFLVLMKPVNKRKHHNETYAYVTRLRSPKRNRSTCPVLVRAPGSRPFGRGYRHSVLWRLPHRYPHDTQRLGHVS